MKRLLPLFLTLSLLANAILGWLASRPRSMVSIPGPSAGVGMPRLHPATPAAPPASPVLDWRSLEAPDFSTYIANLRRAGCPEATIRHLIEPELHAVFEARRLSHAAEPSSPAQESDALAALLDVPLATAPTGSPSGIHPPSLLPSLPAAFLVGDAASAGAHQDSSLSLTPTDDSLAPETLETLASMRQQFGDQITSGGADPSSREYYRAWLKAQRLSDDYFASLYGGDHFISVQQQANLRRSQVDQVTKLSN